MISNLNKGAFQSFGKILTIFPETCEKQSLTLQTGSRPTFFTKTDTFISCDCGMAVLSCGKKDGSFCHFYLDKPVMLFPGIEFSLSPFESSAHIHLFGDLETLPDRPQEDFRIHRRLKLDLLYTFFYQEKEPGFLFSGESHPVVELAYVDQGELHSVADGQDFLLKQGDLTIYRPNQWHMQYADVDIAPRFLIISFDPGDYDLSPLYDRKISLTQRQVGLLQEMLHQQALADIYSEDMILSLLTQLLLSLLCNTQSPAQPLQYAHSLKNENTIISRAQQYIAANVQGRLSVPDTAKNAGVSASYLTALFHKHLQISPGDYIRRIKLQEAKLLIRSGTMNFTQIAEALNYSTVHHFSRQFKENFGITPSDYAKSIK